MGRQPCCEKVGLKKGPWTAEEDKKLVNFILTNGQCCWRAVPKLAGLLRCGKSCRLRWTNYLRPDLKRGLLSKEEEKMVIDLHSQLGNRWSKIASHLPGRTDNEIKNYWNTHIKKKLRKMGIDPVTHKPLPSVLDEPDPQQHQAADDAIERVDSPKPEEYEIETTTSQESIARDMESLLETASATSPVHFCTDEVPLLQPHEFAEPSDFQIPCMEWQESAEYLCGMDHDSINALDFIYDEWECQRSALDHESWKFELF